MHDTDCHQIDCQQFESRLQQLLDERQRPAEDHVLQVHANACQSCRQLLHGQTALFDYLPHAMKLLNPATCEWHGIHSAVGVERDLAPRLPSVAAVTKTPCSCPASECAGRVRLRQHTLGATIRWTAALVTVMALACWSVPHRWLGNGSASSDVTTSHRLVPDSTIVAASPGTTAEPVHDLPLAERRPSNQTRFEGQPMRSAPAHAELAARVPLSPSPEVGSDGTRTMRVAAWNDSIAEAWMDDVADWYPRWSDLSLSVTRPFRPVADSMATALGVIRQSLPGASGEAAPQAPLDATRPLSRVSIRRGLMA